MGNKLKEILNSINTRFPSGRHSSRLILMLNGTEPYNKDEVIRDLNGIIEVGGSDRRYTSDNDKKDATNLLKQLKDYHFLENLSQEISILQSASIPGIISITAEEIAGNVNFIYTFDTEFGAIAYHEQLLSKKQFTSKRKMAEYVVIEERPRDSFE